MSSPSQFWQLGIATWSLLLWKRYISRNFGQPISASSPNIMSETDCTMKDCQAVLKIPCYTHSSSCSNTQRVHHPLGFPSEGKGKRARKLLVTNRSAPACLSHALLLVMISNFRHFSLLACRWQVNTAVLRFTMIWCDFFTLRWFKCEMSSGKKMQFKFWIVLFPRLSLDRTMPSTNLERQQWWAPVPGQSQNHKGKKQTLFCHYVRYREHTAT